MIQLARPQIFSISLILFWLLCCSFSLVVFGVRLYQEGLALVFFSLSNLRVFRRPARCSHNLNKTNGKAKKYGGEQNENFICTKVVWIIIIMLFQIAENVLNLNVFPRPQWPSCFRFYRDMSLIEFATNYICPKQNKGQSFLQGPLLLVFAQNQQMQQKVGNAAVPGCLFTQCWVSRLNKKDCGAQLNVFGVALWRHSRADTNTPRRNRHKTKKRAFHGPLSIIWTGVNFDFQLQ